MDEPRAPAVKRDRRQGQGLNFRTRKHVKFGAEIMTAPVVKPAKSGAVCNRNPAAAIAGQSIPEAVDIGPCTLATLPAHGCKWPLAMSDGERTFCGRSQLAGDRRYCAAHAKRSGPSVDYLRQAQKVDARIIKDLGRKGRL